MDDDQQFFLRWHDHQSTLIAVFDTLLENGTLVDCTLAAEGKFLNAHKVVLSACSPYFETLLSQNYDKHPVFILKDIKFQELKCMIDYMYRGEVSIAQDQLGALLKAAESLQIKGLSDNKKSQSESKKTDPPSPTKSPPPAPAIKQRRHTDCNDRSQSPVLHRRKRLRRRSGNEIENNHEESESHHDIPLLPLPLPVETKQNGPEIPIDNEKLETHTQLILEPKPEYVEELNEDSVEDLTLDDDDDGEIVIKNDDAGPSHFEWHVDSHCQDEVFIVAREAASAQKDSQGVPVSNPVDRYPCANCERSYSNVSNLNRHIKFECGVSRKFFCNYCEKAYRYKQKLQIHVATAHPQIRKSISN